MVGPRSDRRGVRRHAHAGGLLHASWLTVLLVVAAEIAAGALLVAVLLVALVVRRMRMRSRRKYALYELHLSMHDQAKPQDLEDMVESIANIVRAFPAERARSGQPYVALELICGEGEQGMEWSINVRCQPSAVRALDAAISAAYPDVRVGRRHADAPLPRTGALRVPGCVMRFRKERSFVYPLLAAGEELASPPLEQIARAQVALAATVDRALSAHPHPVLLRGVRPPALQAPREQARPPGALGAARGRPALDAQPDRDAQRGAHPEPQPVLARAGDRRRHHAVLQDGGGRRPIAPRREPASPPLDDRPPEPLPPSIPPCARTAGAHRPAAWSRRPRSRTCSRCRPRG